MNKEVDMVQHTGNVSSGWSRNSKFIPSMLAAVNYARAPNPL